MTKCLYSSSSNYKAMAEVENIKQYIKSRKQDLKVSEARILVYLNQADGRLRTLLKISSKLDIDYSYANKIISVMISKRWIYKERGTLRPYYHISVNAPLKEAKQVLMK